MIWRCRDRTFDLSSGALVMGVLNVTPDSFSDGGKYLDAEAAVERGLRMATEGADIVDVGGESTRPGSAPVDAAEECRRVVPVVEALAAAGDVCISIDTAKASVAGAAISAGADIVNDITAMRSDPEMGPLAARSGAGVVLMHMAGEPRTMQVAPHYEDVAQEIVAFLLERDAWAIEQGIDRDRIALDPGIGFGKTTEHNLEIFRRLPEFAALGRPLLIGASRKSFIRRLLADEAGNEPEAGSEETLDGTAAAVAASVLGGASIVRVHDVAPMARVARVAWAVRSSSI